MQFDQPKFSYELREPGSSLAVLQFADEEIQFELTNVSNPLGDLLEGLVTMITTPSHMWGEENSCHVIWYGESSTYNWTITHLDDEKCRVKITESVDFFGDNTEADLLEMECRFHEFISCIVLDLDKFIKKTGLLNYSQRWQKDEFPITQFLFLKKTLIDNNEWKSTKDASDSTLNSEFVLLLS